MYVVQMRSGFVLQMKQLAPFLEGGREKQIEMVSRQCSIVITQWDLWGGQDW